MKFWEAMKIYEEGGKVRSVNWIPGHFLDKSYNGLAICEKMDFIYHLDDEWELSTFNICPFCGDKNNETI